MRYPAVASTGWNDTSIGVAIYCRQLNLGYVGSFSGATAGLETMCHAAADAIGHRPSIIMVSKTAMRYKTYRTAKTGTVEDVIARYFSRRTICRTLAAEGMKNRIVIDTDTRSVGCEVRTR